MSERPEQRDSGRQFWRRLLVTVGWLIVGVAGPCSLFFLVGLPLSDYFLVGVSWARSWEDMPLVMIFVGIFGGVPLLLGGLLIYFGRKSGRPEQSDSERQFQGRLLVTVGVMIVLLVGTYTGFVPGYDIIWLHFVEVFSGRVDLKKSIALLFLSLLLVAVPMLVGILVIHFGRKKLRRSTIKSSPPDDRP